MTLDDSCAAIVFLNAKKLSVGIPHIYTAPVLGLRTDSSQEWVENASLNVASVLRDHAHCEKKAALMAISLINRYPDRSELVEAMTGLAQEEISHFAMVLEKMRERRIGLTRDKGDPYVQQLQQCIRKQEPDRLLDTLIVSSLIEARSCERFRQLSERVEDEDLAQFYRSLLESEAHHRMQFLRLARIYAKPVLVTIRLAELEKAEAEIVSSLESTPVIHG